MRRTAPMVLVLGSLLLTAAVGSPLLLAQTDAPAPSAKHHSTSTHAHSRTAHRTAARHTSAPTAPCQAPRAAAHKRQTSRTLTSHAQPTPRSRRTAARQTPTPAVETQTAEVQPPPDVPEQPAPEPVAKQASFSRSHTAMPPPMRGSLTSLERQNEKAEADGLERIEDEDDLSDRIARKMLVPVPASAELAVNATLPEHHRYCRPWTARFLSDLAHAHAAQFHDALEVSSAVRTVEYQKRLIAINGNAAPAEGDIASPHLTGATIDIAKSGMSRQEIGWMRAFLLPLQNAGKIDVEEEFQQACFHITVYKSYVPARPASTTNRAGQRKPTHPRPRPSTSDATGGASALGR